MKHALAQNRIDALERLLAEQGSAAVSQVAKRLKVSEMTVRRDLDKLAARGGVARVHGGAVAHGTLRFGSRLERGSKAKAEAARKLLPLIPQHGAIYLDGSTTIYQLVGLLSGYAGLTVATNNLDTFLALSRQGGIEPVLIGGTLNRATDNFVGPFARRCLDGMAFTAALFSAYALDATVGPSEPVSEDAELKSFVCSRCERVGLAVDADKLGLRATSTWHLPTQVTLATNLDPSDPRLVPFHPRFATIL
ncbi:MAG: DeoR/GlpR family DNA-binding transcription regulator [Planctomycetota bacterium]